MNTETYLSLCLLTVVLIAAGSIACLPLFAMSPRRLIASPLWTKIVWWLPLFAALSALLFYGMPTAIAAAVVIVILAMREAYRSKAPSEPVSSAYILYFACVTLSVPAVFALVPAPAVFLATVAFVSVLSDVFAFFFGNYVPRRHRLPGWINPGKSWEGVLGQFVGALVGAGLLAIIGFHAPLWAILLIGAASAAGDLFNSAAKRSLNIKDWGRTIPGHGGVLDRFSSLFTALAAMLIATLLGAAL